MYRKNNSELYIFAIIAAALLCSLFALVSSADAKESTGVSARAAALYAPSIGEFLYEKNADQRLPMASTTKIMTALVVLEHIDSLDDTVTVSEDCVGIEGSSAYLKAGEVLTIEELLYALMLRSANDAAAVLATHIGRSIEGFATLMNEKASELGLTDTEFKNPHGLDTEGHYTTARELAIIASAAMENADFRRIVSTNKISFTHGELTRTYVNHNKLLWRYDGCIGIKTGYTKKCGRCLVSATEKNGLMLVAVTIDAPNDWSDHTLLHDSGHEEYEELGLIEPGEYSYDVGVLGSDTEFILVTNIEGLSLTLKRSEHTVEREVVLPRYLNAPISNGDEIGYIIFKLDGAEVGRVSLVAMEGAKEQKKNGFINKILSLLGAD